MIYVSYILIVYINFFVWFSFFPAYFRELFEGRGFSQPGDDSGISEVSSNESHLDANVSMRHSFKTIVINDKLF